LTYYAHETESADEQYELEMASVEILPKMKKSYDKPHKPRKKSSSKEKTLPIFN